MGWDRSAATNPIYRSPEHRRYRASLVAQLKRNGYLICTAKECLFETREITNLNGRARDGLHAGHNDSGTAYDGPQHNACNVTDGARRGRARQETTDLQWLQGEVPPHPWLRKDYHPCPVCSAIVTWESQRCCSKACATTLRRAQRADRRPTVRPVQIKTCALCGSTHSRPKAKYCTLECGLEANARSNRDRYRVAQGLDVDPEKPTRPRARVLIARI